MTIRRELVIDFKDLSQMVLPCPKCESTITILVRTAEVPQECPSCHEEYDPAFRQAVRDFRQVYKRLTDPKSRSVQFRIAAEG